MSLKKFVAVVFCALILTLSACISLDHSRHINIYYLTDLHGCILEDSGKLGLSSISNLIHDEFEQHPDSTIFISGGDMLQGDLVSAFSHGATVIDILNHMKNSAFTIGNHEFDWGLAKVTRYFGTGHQGVQAHFPLLGANVYYKGTNIRPEFVRPYTVVSRCGFKIGIIGVIGRGLESSISEAKIRDYEFRDPLVEVKRYARQLRMTEGVSVVLVVIHDNDKAFNAAVCDLKGSEHVDALFTGHSRGPYVKFYPRRGADLPVFNQSARPNVLGRLRLNLNPDGTVSGYSFLDLKCNNEPRLCLDDPVVLKKGADAVASIETSLGRGIFEPILRTAKDFSRGDLAFYMAHLIRVSSDSDIAFHSYEGVKSGIGQGEELTLDRIFKIYPFDDHIKTTYLAGKTINSLLTQDRYRYRDMRPGIVAFERDNYYKVAANDYVFDQPNGVFVQSLKSEDTGICVRGIFENKLRQLKAEGCTCFEIKEPENSKDSCHEEVQCL